MGWTDFELLASWQAGDNAAGNQLFQRHVDAVTRFFRNKVDRDIEDLVQETFMSCLRSRDSFRQDSSFRTFLFTIARRRLYDFFSRNRREAVDFTSASVVDLGASPTAALAARQEQQLLLRALRAIPLDFQVALELYYWEGLDGPALAEVLDLNPNTVRSRLSRARAALEERIAALADSPATSTSTLSDLDGWARQVRELGGR